MIISRDLVYALDDPKGCDRIAESSGRRPVEPDIVEELFELDGPGVICHRELRAGRLGRTDFRQHPVEGDALGAIAPARTEHVDLAATAVDLEGEGVLP